MIEYTIVVNNINTQTGKMVVTLNPQVANTELEGLCSPLSLKLDVTKEQIALVSSLVQFDQAANTVTVTPALEELRKIVVKENDMFQARWQQEIDRMTVAIPAELQQWMGHEFPVVTAEEVAAVANT